MGGTVGHWNEGHGCRWWTISCWANLCFVGPERGAPNENADILAKNYWNWNFICFVRLKAAGYLIPLDKVPDWAVWGSARSPCPQPHLRTTNLQDTAGPIDRTQGWQFADCRQQGLPHSVTLWNGDEKLSFLGEWDRDALSLGEWEASIRCLQEKVQKSGVGGTEKNKQKEGTPAHSRVNPGWLWPPDFVWVPLFLSTHLLVQVIFFTCILWVNQFNSQGFKANLRGLGAHFIRLIHLVMCSTLQTESYICTWPLKVPE